MKVCITREGGKKGAVGMEDDDGCALFCGARSAMKSAIPEDSIIQYEIPSNRGYSPLRDLIKMRYSKILFGFIIS